MLLDGRTLTWLAWKHPKLVHALYTVVAMPSRGYDDAVCMDDIRKLASQPTKARVMARCWLCAINLHEVRKWRAESPKVRRIHDYSMALLHIQTSPWPQMHTRHPT